MSLLRQILLGAALLAAVAGYLWLTHARLDRAEVRAATAETTARDLRGALAAAKTSERIVTHYVDRVQVIHQRGATITREVPVYVTAKADADCRVPIGFVRLFNAAAEGSDGTGVAHAPSSTTAGTPRVGAGIRQQ